MGYESVNESSAKVPKIASVLAVFVSGQVSDLAFSSSKLIIDNQYD